MHFLLRLLLLIKHCLSSSSSPNLSPFLPSPFTTTTTPCSQRHYLKTTRTPAGLWTLLPSSFNHSFIGMRTLLYLAVVTYLFYIFICFHVPSSLFCVPPAFHVACLFLLFVVLSPLSDRNQTIRIRKQKVIGCLR